MTLGSALSMRSFLFPVCICDSVVLRCYQVDEDVLVSLGYHNKIMQSGLLTEICFLTVWAESPRLRCQQG
jgi:hypothetical protein